MPLDGSNNYYYPLGTPGVPNQTIESQKYNTFLDDLVMNDLNVARPVSRGGTGASTPEQARTNLGVLASAGGTITGSLVVAPVSDNATLNLNKPASGASSNVQGRTNGLTRWVIELGDAVAETGADAGSNFNVHRFIDAGTSSNVALTINRATGAMVVNGATTISGALTATAKGNQIGIHGGVSAASAVSEADANFTLYTSGPGNWAGMGADPGGNMWFRTGLTAGQTPAMWIGSDQGVRVVGSMHANVINTTGITNTGNLVVNGTTTLGNNLTLNAGGITVSAGNASVSGTVSAGGVTSSGNISSSGSITATAGISCNNLTTLSLTVNGNAVWHAGNFNPANYVPLSGDSVISGNLATNGWIRAGNAAGQGTIYFGNAGQNMNFNTTNSDGWRLQGGAGGFHIDTNATKPGGGTWDAPSDGRVKTLLGEYDRGLDQIRRLKPQRFKYKDKSFDLVKDREFIGFVAQDVEPVMPEMVRKKTGVIDGKEVQDFRMTDTTALIYALVNAVRELSDRVEELESAG